MNAPGRRPGHFAAQIATLFARVDTLLGAARFVDAYAA